MSLAFVQATSAHNDGSAASISAPAISTTTGNLIVVAVRSNAGISVTSVTDTAGNTYTLIDTQIAPIYNSPLTMFYAKNITGNASNVVTANFSGSVNYRGISVQEISGADTTNPFDVSAKGSANGPDVTTGSFTTTVADTIVVCGMTPEAVGESYTPGSGYTIPSGATSDYTTSQYQIFSSIQSSATASCSTGNTNGKAIIAAAFKMAGGGSDTITASSIASLEAFGTASLTHWIAPSAIGSGEAFGTATLSQSLAPTGIAGAEAFGTATLTLTVASSSIGSAEAFGIAVISTENAIICTGIDSAEAFGSHTLSHTIFPSAIDSAEAFGTTIIFGSDTIVASGISSGEAFGTARLDLSITASGIAGGEDFGTASLGPGITAQAISGGEAFGTATLSETLVITATGIATGEAFGSASLGHVVLAQAIAGAEAFGIAVLAGGVVVSTPVPTLFATLPANKGHLRLPTSKGHLTIPNQR